MAAKAKSIDDYLAGLSTEHRAALQKLRAQIHKAAPGAEEYISYGLAAFKLHGRPLVAFAGWKAHCAFYPMSGRTVEALKSELAGFETSRGTIRFTVQRPLPAALVQKLVKTRIRENLEREKR